VFIHRREPGVALRHAEEVLAACGQEPNPQLEALASTYRGWALGAQGRADEGAAIVRAGLARRIELGTRLGIAADTNLLAETLAASGQIDAALAVMVEGEGACLPGDDNERSSTLRLRAELLARKVETSSSKGEPPPTADEVEQVYNESLDLARRQGARGIDLRTATSYAGWLGRHGPRRGGTRAARTDLRQLHRGLRHPRPDRGEGAARRAVGARFRRPSYRGRAGSLCLRRVVVISRSAKRGIPCP
jgi:hypothetical protein